jgi:hypothetical protein
MIGLLDSPEANAVGATAATTAPLAAELRKSLRDLVCLFSIFKYKSFTFST